MTAKPKITIIAVIIKKIFRIEIKHIVLEFRQDEPNNTFSWHTKVKFLQTIYKNTDLILVSAKSEVSNYTKRLKLPEGKIKFLPFHTNVISPVKCNNNNGYLFCAGRNGRDYATFFEIVNDLGLSSVIVANKQSIGQLELPSNARLYTDIPYEEYLKLLRGAALLVIPLYEKIYATGQVVILEAMSYGIPVITNKVTGTVDYIKQGINGILVDRLDKKLFTEAVKATLADTVLYDKLSQNGYETILKSHTFEAYTSAIFDYVNTLTQPIKD